MSLTKKKSVFFRRLTNLCDKIHDLKAMQDSLYNNEKSVEKQIH